MPALPAVLLRNALAGAISYAGAFVWTRVVSRLSTSGALPARLARKLSHITTAPFFLLTWPLYAPGPAARWVAAVVPLSFAARIARAPSRDAFASATARGSDLHSEAGGLMAYGLAVALITALGWRHEAATYVAAAALACGDGAADVVGGAVGGPVIPLPARDGRRKTVAGSVAFVAATVLGSLGMLRMARAVGFGVAHVAKRELVKIAALAAAVELAPVEDNLIVPLTAFFATRHVLSQRWWVF